METSPPTRITIESTINEPVEKVWRCFTEPQHIVHWNFASDDWHTPKAENDLRVGGHFVSRMEAKDGSFGFDFSGEYTAVEENQLIEYKLGDTRTVRITFEKMADNQTKVVESFDAEETHSIEMQKSGWQSILDNFKKYTETN